MPGRTHHPGPSELLGLAPGGRPADVRRAWRALAARHHPDVGGDAATFAALTAARDQLLSDAGRHPAPVLHRSTALQRALRPVRRRIDRRRRPRVT